MLTEQEQFWQGDFGRDYTARNRLNWKLRLPFWEAVIDKTKAKSVLEVGCNIGTNLRCLRDIDPSLAAWGCDINQIALQEAADAGFSVVDASVFDLRGLVGIKGFDLVATCGVLIHIGPADIERAMRSIIGASRLYVLAVEYADDTEVEVNYRGHSERLWRRPFGKMYEKMGLKLVKTVKVDKEHGFDDCTAWLMSKE